MIHFRRSFEPLPEGAPPLTIIGASVRAAAESARHAGFAPIAGDCFADADLQAIAVATRVADYPEGLEAVIAGPQLGPWMYTGALENRPDLVERWSQLRPLLGNSAATLWEVRDPFVLGATLTAEGFNRPAIARNADALPNDGTWLRKPVRSAGGLGIVRWRGQSIVEDTDAYFQRYVTGQSCSAAYVAAGKECVLLGVTQQLLDGETFRYGGSIGPLPLSDQQQLEFTKLGSVLAEEFKLVGLFGVDCVLNEQGVWPTEVNPRYTASMEVLERACGFSAVGLHVATCRGEALPTIADHADRLIGKQIVFADRDVTCHDEFGDDVADVPSPQSLIKQHSPIATVFAEGATVAEVEQRLAEAHGRLLGKFSR